ncbi:MAG: aminotransferase class V-fold PLP-dependent enzyme [Eubacterium sp.]|nr:aminotransferase class V-fold PLP-dependent enzyme [Eubacterium sp.]
MIYFDNSATSYPKPMSVYLKTLEAQLKYSFNSGRGGYKESVKSAEKLFDVRQKLATLFNADASNVVFTKNCTEALNIAIKGCAKKGGHILMSSLEHNSVSRVVYSLFESSQICFDTFKFSYDDSEILMDIKRKIKPETCVLICTHASNVFGVTFPIKRIGDYCKRRGIPFVCDCAQTAGILDVDVKKDNIDILCTAGHKGLMGAMGTGAMLVNNCAVKPLLQGGTGTSSLDLEHPYDMPEGFEAGTLNNSGIVSMGAGVDYINKKGMSSIYSHEMAMCKYLYSELSRIPGVKLYTPPPESYKAVPIIALNYKNYSSEKTAALLAEHGICTRAGFHCSPLAHEHFKTTDRGVVRISLGAFNTFSQCEKFIKIIKAL